MSGEMIGYRMLEDEIYEESHWMAAKHSLDDKKDTEKEKLMAKMSEVPSPMYPCGTEDHGDYDTMVFTSDNLFWFGDYGTQPNWYCSDCIEEILYNHHDGDFDLADYTTLNLTDFMGSDHYVKLLEKKWKEVTE